MPKPSFFERLGGSHPVFDPRHKFVSSPFFSSTILACIRSAIALYTLGVLFFALIYQNVKTHNGSGFFSYFTELSYIGICSYYWASSVQTVAFVRSGHQGYPLQKWGKTLQVLHMMLGTTIVVFPILVTVIFWALLASSKSLSSTFLAWDNISFHALNTVFSLFEVIFTNSPPPSWWMLPFLIVILALYLGVAYITHFTQGFYTYSFLDPSKQHAKLAAYIVSIMVAELILFSLVKGLMTLRQRFSSSSSTNSQSMPSSLNPKESFESGEKEKRDDMDIERGLFPRRV